MGDRSSRPDRTERLEDGKAFLEQVGKAVRHRHRPVLVVLSGESVGTRCVLTESMLVGRDPDSGLCLPDTGVSWHHARVDDQGGVYAVVDLGSTNGTSVNGEPASDRELVPGDKLVFGRTMVRFELQDTADEAYDDVVAKMLSVDDLSGLYVRRHFDAELQGMLTAAATRREPVGLLVMDLDGIKQINDENGHLFGAYVIGEAGHLIGGILRGRGIGARFGGDEYVAALPRHDLESAVEVGEEIRRAIDAHRFVREGISLHPSISIGAAAYPLGVEDAKALFHRADEALYRAKRAGKNRVST